MNHGDRRQIIAEDGSIYEVEAVRVPNSVLTHALVANEAMQAKAARLLPIAQKMAESKATHASFFRASERGLQVYGARVYTQAEEEARETRKQAKAFSWLQRACLLRVSWSLPLSRGEKS